MPINISLVYDAADISRIEHFQMPVAPDELRQRLDRLGFTPEVMDEISIEAVLVDGPFGGAVTQLDSPETVVQMDELNYLAAKYDELDAGSKEKSKMVLEYIGHGHSRYPHEPGNIGDTIDIMLNLDKFVYYPGVLSLQQLGQHVIDNNKQDETEIDLTVIPHAPDYREVGENIYAYDKGCFTSRGYVSGGGQGFIPVFAQEGVPEEYRVWEKAFGELPPFENPIDIDYENLSEGHANEWQFNEAHAVFEHLVNIRHPNFNDGGHRHRGATIIEIAEMIRTQDDALDDILLDSIISGGMYGDEAADLIERIANPDDGFDVQLLLERSYGIDNDFEEHYREDLMKLPPDLQFDEYIKGMMENRARHQQTITELSGQEPPLNAMPPEQLARFHMLPADKQVAIQLEQDTFTLYNRVKTANATAMINLYSEKIMEYQEEHMRNGPYDSRKIEQATEIKDILMQAVKQEYECDPNRQPVVNIDSHGCDLFPVGKRFPFPVFNDLFTQAVDYYSLLHDAGVPLSQSLVYLNMDFVMEGQPEKIRFHSDKSVLLFVDQGRSFMEQIAAASYLEPAFREKFTAYLSMHLGVDEKYRDDLAALPNAIKNKYPQGLPGEVIELAPDMKSFIRYGPPDYAQQLRDFATEAHENINQRTDYAAMMFSRPLPEGDIPAIAERYQALIEAVDPIGYGRLGIFNADDVSAALSQGESAKIEDYLIVLGNVEGVYKPVAQGLVAAIERIPASELQQEQTGSGDTQPIRFQMSGTVPDKPSIAEALARAKQAALEQIKQPKDPNKSGPEH